MSRLFGMPVSRVYPLYVSKLERRGRTVEELDQGKAMGKVLRSRSMSW
jgi:hypothetical protein